MVTNSERFMISKPFEPNMAIFDLKKITSYDSEGRKKSYDDINLRNSSRRYMVYTHPIDAEPL